MSHLITLKKNYQFQRVFREGQSYSTKHLVLFVVPNQNGSNRIGFVVGKKVGNSVIRNRVKRLMREVFRSQNDTLKQGYDMILLARYRASDLDFWVCKNEFIKLAQKAKILDK